MIPCLSSNSPGFYEIVTEDGHCVVPGSLPSVQTLSYLLRRTSSQVSRTPWLALLTGGRPRTLQAMQFLVAREYEYGLGDSFAGWSRTVRYLWPVTGIFRLAVHCVMGGSCLVGSARWILLQEIEFSVMFCLVRVALKFHCGLVLNGKYNNKSDYVWYV